MERGWSPASEQDAITGSPVAAQGRRTGRIHFRSGRRLRKPVAGSGVHQRARRKGGRLVMAGPPRLGQRLRLGALELLVCE
jgi:hypothetical protein